MAMHLGCASSHGIGAVPTAGPVLAAADDDAMFEPVLARIAALDLPNFLRAQQTIGGKRLGGFCNPIDTAIAAAHLIFGGALDRHPKNPAASFQSSGAATTVGRAGRRRSISRRP